MDFQRRSPGGSGSNAHEIRACVERFTPISLPIVNFATTALRRFSPVILIISWLSTVASARAAEKSLAELEREANRVMAEPDNVARRKLIAPVFQFAERCVAAGKTNEARHYFTKGLEHQPWNLRAQLAVARLLKDADDTNGARQKAELVWKYAETDALLAQAAELLGEPFATRLESESLPTDAFALALVPCGETEAWLVRQLRDDLRNALGIPVVIRQVPLQFPKPNRDPLHQWAEDLRGRIARSRKDARFQLSLQMLNLHTNSLTTDNDVFNVTEALLNTEKDKEPARRFREELALLRRLGPQWEASGLVQQMGKEVGARPGSGMGYLGVTQMDLYGGESRFVFGLAAQGGNCGLISYHRYTSALADEPPNRNRLGERTLKQALSSVGLLFGLARCTDPTCPRAYANGLTEHDAKQSKLCATCQQSFAKRFGRKSD